MTLARASVSMLKECVQPYIRAVYDDSNNKAVNKPHESNCDRSTRQMSNFVAGIYFWPQSIRLIMGQ